VEEVTGDRGVITVDEVEGIQVYHEFPDVPERRKVVEDPVQGGWGGK